MKSYVFPLAKTRSEIRPFLYSGKFGKSSFSWDGLTDPGITPLNTCKKHAIAQIAYFNIALRFVFIVLSIVFNALDSNVGEFWQNPEKMVGVLIVYYFFVTLIYATLKRFAYFKENWFDNRDVPIPLQIAWFCYDIALPSSYGILILYFQMRQRHYQMEDGLYILNVVVMSVDLIGGQMILFPGHIYWYIGVVFFSGIYYKNRFGASIEQALVGFIVLIVCYIIISFVTYLRAQLTDISPATYPESDRNDEESVKMVDVEKMGPGPSVSEIQESEEPEIVSPMKSWFNRN